MLLEKPKRMWESEWADIFTIDNKHSLCIVDYHGILPITRQVEGISRDSLIKTCQIFLEYGLPSKIVSDAGSNFVSEKFENFCKCLSMHPAV